MLLGRCWTYFDQRITFYIAQIIIDMALYIHEVKLRTIIQPTALLQYV